MTSRRSRDHPDANNVFHGFVHQSDRGFSTFRDAGTSLTANDFNGSVSCQHLVDWGVVLSYYIDKNSVILALQKFHVERDNRFA